MKKIKEVAYYTNLKSFESLFEKEQKEGEDIYVKNMKIYINGNGDLRDEKIEEIVLIDTLPLPDLYIGTFNQQKIMIIIIK